MVLKLVPWKRVTKGTRHQRSQIYAVVVREIETNTRLSLLSLTDLEDFVGQSKKWHISLPPTFHWLVSEHTSLKGTLGNEVLLCLSKVKNDFQLSERNTCQVVVRKLPWAFFSFADN